MRARIDRLIRAITSTAVLTEDFAIHITQGDCDARAVSLVGGDGNVATMHVNDPFTNRQSEACALGLGCEEGLERLFPLLISESWSIVMDSNSGHVLAMDHLVVCNHVDSRHRSDCVFKQVSKDLFHSERINHQHDFRDR